MKNLTQVNRFIAERAIGYRRMRLNPLPLLGTEHGLQNSGKKAAIRWTPLQKAAAPVEEIRRWYEEHPEWNVGLITGASGKIVVVDSDSAEAVAFVETTLPRTPMQVLTTKGRHFYFTHPGTVVRNGVKLRSMPLDVRGDGGYVVAPPSTGWTGHAYAWIEEPSAKMLKILPTFDPAWLAKERVAPHTPIEPHSVDPVKRAAAYVARIEGAVSGQAGHAHTMRVAGILIQKFGLSMSQALPLMILWNSKCAPPWTERELVHKLQDAVKNLASQSEPIVRTTGGT
ncbi:MAG: bifunctional DNA primase/polymerase [Pirellulales bacterium]